MTVRCGLVLFALALTIWPAMARCPEILMRPGVQAQARQIIEDGRGDFRRLRTDVDAYRYFANTLNRWLLVNAWALRFGIPDSRQVIDTLRNPPAAIACFPQLGPFLELAAEQETAAKREAAEREARTRAAQQEAAERETRTRAAQQEAAERETRTRAAQQEAAEREARTRATQQVAQSEVAGPKQLTVFTTAPSIPRESVSASNAWLPDVVRENLGETVLVFWGLIVLAAFFLSLSGRATSYRHAGDAGFTFLVLALFGIGIFYGQTKIIGPTALILSACGAGVVVLLAFRDNPNPLYATIAIITKLSLSALFVVLGNL